MGADDREPAPLAGSGAGNGARAGAGAATMGRVRAAFLDLIDRDYDRVVRFLMMAGASTEDAQDAVQDAFAQGWCAVAAGRWESIGSPRAWIRRVAVNAWHRPPGQKRRQPSLVCGAEMPDVAVPGECHAELTDQTRIVLATLRTLPEPERIVMALHLDGFTCVEAAFLLEVSDQKARDLLKQARKTLRRNLAPTVGRKEDA